MKELKINEKEEKILLHFEGDYGIDIEILLSCLEYTRTALKSAKKYLPNVENYKVLVKPFHKGSFLVEIAIIIQTLAEILPAYKTMGEVFLSTLNIWKTIKGENPKEIVNNRTENIIQIVGNDNQILLLSNEEFSTIKDTKKISDNISNMTKKMTNENKKNIESFSCSLINEKGETTIRFSYNDIKSTQNPIYFANLTNQKEINQQLMILKPITIDFLKNDDWRFTSNYIEKPFKAKIADIEFINKIRNGLIVFSNDTYIEAMVEIESTIKEINNIFGAINYTIIKVLKLKNSNKEENFD